MVQQARYSENAKSLKVAMDEASQAGGIFCPLVLIDLCGGDINTGLLLSRIVYWHMPDKSGNPRLKVEKEGHLWLARKRSDWYNEIRLSEKQVDRATKNLTTLGYIVAAPKNYKFSGVPVPHIRLDYDAILKALSAHRADVNDVAADSIGDAISAPKRQGRSGPNGKVDFTQRGKSITLHSKEHSTKDTLNTNASQPAGCDDTPSLETRRKRTGTTDRDAKNLEIAQRVLESEDFRRQRASGLTPQDLFQFVKYYLGQFKRLTGSQHPVYSYKLWLDKLSNIGTHSDETGGFGRAMEVDSLETLITLVDAYFETEYPNMRVDRHIAHFLTDGILLNLFFRYCY